MTDEKKTVFEKMDNQDNVENQSISEQPQVTSNAGEFDYNKLSDKAVGDQVKYNRESLDGQTVTILSAQIFEATDDDEVIEALSGSGAQYKKATFLVTFDCKNADDVYNREYYSGVTQFVQKDGSLSIPNFYYKEGTSQVCELWKAVAKAKNVEAEKLSPREFIAFLNNKPKALIEGKKFTFPGSKPVIKNIIASFVE